MRLLGMPLLVFVGALTVLLPILAVWFWRSPRWSSRPGRTVAGAGLVVASQLAAALLVVTATGHHGHVSRPWAGLRSGASQRATGRSPGHVVARVGTRVGTAAGSRSGGFRAVPDAAFSTPAQWAARGRLETVFLTGPLTGVTAMAHVYLPPEYFQRRYAHTYFPAVEAFTGYPGSPVQLVKKQQYPRLFLRDLQQHQAGPMVLVMMQSSPVMPRDAECTDVPGGPQVESFFAQDVPWQVSHHYRVQRTGWGTIGDSTGGYCATKITMMNPSTFRAAVSLSGYFTTLHDNTTGNLWGGSVGVRNLNNLDWRLQHLPAPPVSVLVTTSRGEGGPLGMGNSLRFLALARPPMQVSSVIAPYGGHVLSTWKLQIPRSLAWLSARLPHAMPAGSVTTVHPGSPTAGRGSTSG